MTLKLLEAFRHSDALRQAADRLAAYAGRPLAFMEVCGTHTVAIMKAGIKEILPPAIRLVSGPGCPVCVTGASYIDLAVALAGRPELIIATFGDLMRVPGSRGSLQGAKAAGADVRMVYSPLDCLALCAAHPDRTVVFLSVGFETTTPVVALLVQQALQSGTRNLLVLTANKTMPEPLEALVADPALRLDGFLLPGHVSAVIGMSFYEAFCARRGVSGAVAGFEPLDLLGALLALVRQAEQGSPTAMNLYPRVVRHAGNPHALAAIAETFEPCDAVWRGLGVIPASGLRLREKYAGYDAVRVLGVSEVPTAEPPGCQCGEILKGKKLPPDCALFGRTCTPLSPVGACMVSSEGSCAAYYRWNPTPSP
jgi:hydrogenase expression/formation protein HypD